MSTKHLISATPRDRGPLPGRTFSFPLMETWRDWAWSALEDFVTQGVKDTFRANPPEYLVSDDLSWLDNLVLETTGKDVDSKNLLAEALRYTFNTLRAAHATRTDNVESFYRHGIRVLRPGEVENRARDLFVTTEYPHASEAALGEVIKRLGARNPAGGRIGTINFCCTEDRLYGGWSSSDHYLVYGSEYLYCIGIRVIGERETQKLLGSIGCPTLFICDLPMTLLSQDLLEGYSGMMIEALFCELIDRRSSWASEGSCPVIYDDLAPQHIVGHFHPQLE